MHEKSTRVRCTEHRLFSTQNHNDNQTQVAARLLYSRFIEILRSDARASAERTMLQSFGQLGVRMVRSNEQSASSIRQSAKSYWTGHVNTIFQPGCSRSSHTCSRCLAEFGFRKLKHSPYCSLLVMGPAVACMSCSSFLLVAVSGFEPSPSRI